MFIQNNQEFDCIHCGKHVLPHKTSSRNHCNWCLMSLHVDIDPGDRRHDCKSVMKPIGLKIEEGTTYIYFECIKCATIKRNKVASDDNQDLLVELSAKPISSRYFHRVPGGL